MGRKCGGLQQNLVPVMLRSGDTVMVEAISRFARNTRDLLELIDVLQRKDVEFVSQKEKIDTSTPTGRFMLTVFAAVAELERRYLLDRQKEGIAIAKAQGKYKGRKPIAADEQLWAPLFITLVVPFAERRIIKMDIYQ